MTSDCILHTGCTMPNGYGQVRREGKTWLAHRWAAHTAHGPCPTGQVVRHSCDTRLCVNPKHLEYGTQGDNLNDRKRHGHRYRKLTREDVLEIRKLLTSAPLTEIGQRFGVSGVMIGHIKSGKQWSDV